MLGTPVFSNLEFPAGNYKTLDGDIISFDGLVIDTVLFSIQQSKNIVTTPVQGKNGTQKEYVSDGDYNITVDGVLVGGFSNVYPEVDVNTLKEIVKVPETLKIISEFLDHFEINDVVITNFDFPQLSGSRNIQNFKLNLLSDTPIELQ